MAKNNSTRKPKKNESKKNNIVQAVEPLNGSPSGKTKTKLWRDDD